MTAPLDADDLFVADVAAALAAGGRSVHVDQETRTIDVGPTADDAPGAPRVFAVVRPVVRGVTLYAVHPRAVPSTVLPEMTELVSRATGDLFAAALELDLTSGVVAARLGVLLGLVEMPDDVLGALLEAASDEVTSVATRYAGPIDSVADGSATPAAAAAAARRAPLEELSPPTS